MKKYLTICAFGFLTWLVPFVIANFFYSKERGLIIDLFMLKTIMMVVFGAFGAFLLIIHFKKVEEAYLKEGIVVGTIWFLINWLMDIIVLIPLSGMMFSDWFVQIGLRYVLIIIMSVSIGKALDNCSTSTKSATNPNVA